MVHNASIMNAVGATGLQLYRFGEAVSIVFFTGEAGSGGWAWPALLGGSNAHPLARLAASVLAPGAEHCPLPAWRASSRAHLPAAPVGPLPPALADTWRPDSFYDRIAANRRAGLHTLCLLDIKVDAHRPLSWGLRCCHLQQSASLS